MALYSAFEEDLETICLFLDFHDTNDFPIKTQYPVTDRLVLEQAPQFKSPYPCNCIFESVG